MAGFTFNGCGASDSYYPIKYIGDFNCPCCGNTMQKFSLMELRMKIRVFFIPTVTVNTKYAVACNKCKNGYYVDETQKNNILSGRVQAIVTSDGVEFNDVEQKIVHTVSVPKNESVASHISEVVDVFNENCNDNTSTDVSNDSIKPGQSDTIEFKPEERNAENIYSEKAQNKSETESTTVPKVNVDMTTFTKRVVKICPHCQMMYNSSKEKCTVCGRDLEIRE